MERTNYFPTQHVLSDDLNNTTATKELQLSTRDQAILGQSSGGSGSVFRGGVFGDPAQYQSSSSSLCVSFNGSSQLIVASGSALTAAGEIIHFPTSLFLNWTPYLIIDIGTQYVWLHDVSATNYVSLLYVEVLSMPDYDFLGGIHYRRSTALPYIFISSTLVPENIQLASFQTDTLGIPQTGSLVDVRSYVTTITAADAIALDPLAAPASALGWTTFEQHAVAYGTGTATRTNVHGLSVADIGVPSNQGSVGSSTFETISNNPAMVTNFVYQNSSSSVIAVAVTCNVVGLGDVATPYVGEYTLEVASVGTLGAGGILTGPITVDRHYVAFDGLAVGTAATGSITRTLFGFVPPSWYYRLMLAVDAPDASGTVIQTTYYLPK